MADVTFNYKGNTIGEISASGTHTLDTQGQYCEDDIEVVYTKPAGPSGTKQIRITANGTTTEDVAAYANAEIAVNVSGGGGGNDGVTQSVKNLGNEAFRYVTTLAKSLNFKSLTTAGSRAFGGISAGLETLVLPAISSAGAYCFAESSSIKTIDFGPNMPDWNAWFFSGDSSLSTVIIRKASVAGLTNINVFNATPFASGGSGGTLYVPSSLISSYENASNWSTILGYANNSIVAIEGSAYETTYADGTIIPT